MAIQNQFFPVDGSTRTFPSTKHIARKSNVAVFGRLESSGTWIQFGTLDYELINNAVVMRSTPLPSEYRTIEVRVADNHSELDSAPSDLSIVAENIEEVKTVAENIDDVVTVADNIEDVKNAEENAAIAAAAAVSASDSATVASNASATSVAAAAEAETYRDEVEAFWSDFDTKYLGAHPSAPLVDNQGDPLIVGAMYFNSSDGYMYVWDGIGWDGVNIESITETSTSTLTNKTIADHSNFVHADAIHQKVRATETINKGQAVYYVGYNLGHETAEVALADKDSFSAGQYDKVALGLAGIDMTANQNGGAIGMGVVEDFDTSAWNDGDLLFLGNNGNLTNVRPTSGLIQHCGFVYRSNPNNGVLLVNFRVPIYTASQTYMQNNQSTVEQEIGYLKENISGFQDKSDSSIDLVFGTKVFSISPTGSEYVYYSDGKRFVETGTQTVTLPSATGEYFIYMDGDGNIAYSPAFDSQLITTYAFIAYVYLNQTEIVVLGDERHGYDMSPSTHEYLHETFGTQYGSGLAMGSFSVDGSGNTNPDAQFSVGAGIIWDEDIMLETFDQGIGTGLSIIPLLHRGTGGAWNRNEDSAPLITTGTGRLAYNEDLGGGNWSLTEIGNNDFVLIHVIATNDTTSGRSKRVMAILGQNDYLTLSQARDGALVEVSNLQGGDLPLSEFKFIGTVIYQTSNNYSNTWKARVRSTEDGDTHVDWREDTISAGGVSTDHNNLAGLQGGAASDYQHLTTTELDKVQNLPTDPSNFIGGTNERNTVLVGGLKLDTVSTKGFGATAWTGDGNVDRDIVTNVDMATANNGGLVWLKKRGSTTYDHILTDTVRGRRVRLESNTTDPEVENTTHAVQLFNDDGFQIDNGSSVNLLNDTYIAWSWQTTRKQEPVYGNGLVTGDTSTFTSSLGDWVKDSGADAATTVTHNSGNGRLLIDAATSFDGAFLSISGLTIGSSYTFEVDCYLGTATVGSMRLLSGADASVECTSDRRLKVTVVPTGGVVTIILRTGSSVGTIEFDNFEVKEVSGSLTSAGKPYTAHYNPEMGFSIVGSECNGGTQDIPHKLGYTPDIVISKNRTQSGDWIVSQSVWTDRAWFKLNSSDAQGGLFTANLGDTTFREYLSSVTIGADGDDIIHYCFRSVPGYSKITTYVGTGASGNIINLDLDMTQAGSMCIIKRLDDTGSWNIFDNQRDSNNVLNELLADSSAIEASDSFCNMVNTGISLGSASSEFNAAGGQYLIMAFTPMYDKATTGIPYVEAGTVVTHAEGFDSTTGYAKNAVRIAETQENVSYISDDRVHLYRRKASEALTLTTADPSNPVYALDVSTMIGTDYLYLGKIKWMDGLAFAVEPVLRTNYTQNISDGTNEFTPAEVRAKLDEPSVGVDGKLVVASAVINTDGAFSSTADSYGFAASVKLGTGNYRLYFDSPQVKYVGVATIENGRGAARVTRDSTGTGEYLDVWTYDTEASVADYRFNIMVAKG